MEYRNCYNLLISYIKVFSKNAISIALAKGSSRIDMAYIQSQRKGKAKELSKLTGNP